MKLDALPMGQAEVYGGLLRLGGRALYQFEIRVRRSGAVSPVIFHWSYDTRH
jgi:hypothetical protein